MVSVIPHTGKETTLLQQKAGDKVNLECDIVGKYVEKLLHASIGRGKTDRGCETGAHSSRKRFFRENGFY